jgi:hypothetical protein
MYDNISMSRGGIKVESTFDKPATLLPIGKHPSQ